MSSAPSWAVPGQVVVCVANLAHSAVLEKTLRMGVVLPVLNAVYVLRTVEPGHHGRYHESEFYVRLCEIRNPLLFCLFCGQPEETAFNLRGFRPARSTSIENLLRAPSPSERRLIESADREIRRRRERVR